MSQKPQDLITIDPQVLGGRPVFRGTRVPVESLLWHLEKSITVDAFLEDFPTVSKAQAVGVLEFVGGLFSPEKIRKLYEAAA